MLQQLKLDESNPLQEWIISVLLEALKRPDGDDRHPVLILDEFTRVQPPKKTPMRISLPLM